MLSMCLSKGDVLPVYLSKGFVLSVCLLKGDVLPVYL